LETAIKQAFSLDCSKIFKHPKEIKEQGAEKLFSSMFLFFGESIIATDGSIPGRRQQRGQWFPPPPFEICAPRFMFGSPVAAHIQYCT